MIAATLPQLQDSGLYQLLRTILRKALDCTVTPLFVDYKNQRVLIGTTVASTSSPGKVGVSGGDVEIMDADKGLIMKTTDGTRFFVRMVKTSPVSAVLEIYPV